MGAILKILMSSIVCNNTQCKYNGGKFCNREILIIYNGACGELVDRRGVQKDPSTWMKTEAPSNEGDTENGQ